MKVVAGILLLVGGFVAPLALLFWLNGRLNRKPAPRPGVVGLLLALNGVLPVALIISGLGLLSARVAASPALHIVSMAAWLAAAIVVVVLVVGVAVRRSGGQDGG
jgi:hypothetical protein